MRIVDFFDTEFKEFSSLDNVRSIPSLVDGFKDSQRKAVYAMMLQGNNEIKVSQFASQAALKTSYHHGEVSMCDTIVNLAQNFTGSNNVNLFEPIGQFGSILSSVSASPRYIFTKPSSYLREYFKLEDDCILEHNYEDGERIEPKYFLPVLPMWIVNGAVGIGTGHSVKILARDPDKVKQAIKKMIKSQYLTDKEKTDLLSPYFKDWVGDVIEVEPGKFELHGKFEIVNATTIRITELPVGYGIDKFKQILADLIDSNKIKDYDNMSTEDGFNFEIKVAREVTRLSEDDIKKLFKLVSRQTENITLWSSSNPSFLKQYESIYNALLEFVVFRLEKYEDRRLKQIEILKDECIFLEQKKLFILEWNKLDNVGKYKLDFLKQHMMQKGVDELHLDRLFSLRLTSLSRDLITELSEQIQSKKITIQNLESTNANQMYLKEL